MNTKYKVAITALVAALFLVQSCTFKRYWKDPESKLKIYSEEPCDVVIDGVPLHVDSVANWSYYSSKENVAILVRRNDLTDTILLEPKKTQWYLPPPDTARFTYRQLERYVNNETHVYRYPARVRLRFKEDGMSYKTFRYPESVRGQKNFLISVPEFNHFYIDRGPRGYGNSFGFFGIGIGLEYFTKHKRYLQLVSELKMDFPVPVPVSLNRVGDYDQSFNYVLSAQYFVENERWSFGGGLGYNAMSYVQRHRGEIAVAGRDSLVHQNTYQAISIPLSAKWRFSRKGLLFAEYAPMFTTVSDDGSVFGYSHTISFGLQVRLELNRKRNEGLR